ncbi:MAG: hypothetical protein WCL08_07685 [Verrucomicrobiota bacterium]
MQKTTREKMLIETGRACFLAQIFSQYSVITSLDLEVTDNDQATDVWAEVHASAEAAIMRRHSNEEPPLDPAPSGAISPLPVAEDWLRSA